MQNKKSQIHIFTFRCPENVICEFVNRTQFSPIGGKRKPLPMGQNTVLSEAVGMAVTSRGNAIAHLLKIPYLCTVIQLGDN